MATTPDGEPEAAVPSEVSSEVSTAGPLILKQPVFHWQQDATGQPVMVELAPGDPAPDSLSPAQIEDFRARGIL
jgi:hypothetical protein